MSRIAVIVVWICSALWLGGMIFLFVAVQALFATFPKTSSDVAINAAPTLFGIFEKYQLFLAGLALVATFFWYLSSRSRLIILIFTLLAVAGAGAPVSSTLITPRMESLRAAGQSGSPRFAQLHARSMLCYMTQAGLLLVATIMLPVAIAARRKAPATDPG